MFQWSLHRLGEDGELEHLEFLAEGNSDPRKGVADSLIDALGSDELPILVYSSYEKRCLNELAQMFPEHESALRGIVDRLVDLLPIVRAGFYHPDLQGSFSIKSVAPVLAPHVTYSDLDQVANGTAAMSAFTRVIRSEGSSSDLRKLREALLAYCKRDTLALLEVYRALRGAVGHSS